MKNFSISGSHYTVMTVQHRSRSGQKMRKQDDATQCTATELTGRRDDKEHSRLF